MAARLIGVAQKIMWVGHRSGRRAAMQAAGDRNEQRDPECGQTHPVGRPRPPHCPADPRPARRNPGVVAADHVEIGIHDERLAARPVRHQQRATHVPAREARAVDAAHAVCLPLGQAAHGVVPAPPSQAFGGTHRLDPRFAHAPAAFGQIVGHRAEHVRPVGPDVAPPIAIRINGVVQVGAGHELRLPHGTGPASGHGARRDVARIQDAQRA